MSITKELLNVKIDDLKPYENNSKLHPDWQIEQIIKSIKKFGFLDPIGINEDYQILEGHGRYLACKELKMSEIPCVMIKGLTEAQQRAYVIAHNKLTTNTGFDKDKLTYELNALKLEDFDLQVTGFTEYELQDLLNHLEIFDNTQIEDDELLEEYKEPNKKIVCPECGYKGERKEFKDDE